MKLLYAPASPYARKVRVLINELGLGSRVATQLSNPLDDPPELLALNPLAKVPVLVRDGEPALLDSLVICLHLIEIGKGDNGVSCVNTDVLNRHAIAQGVTDAAFAMVIERRRSPDRQSAGWLRRWQRAIERGVAHAGTQTKLDRFDLGDLALIVVLEYLDFRLPDVEWRSTNPELSNWLARYSDRPGFAATRPA